MTITVKVKIEGGEELLRRLKKVCADVDTVLETAAKDGAEVIREEAISLAPGDHIVAEVADSRTGQAKVEIGPDEDHWYYKFFETGTSAHEVKPSVRMALKLGDDIFAMIANPSGIVAKPFLRPALDEKSDAAKQVVGDRLWKAAER